MKLVKLVFISHDWYLALKDEPLLDEGVQAWQYGPVVPTVYHAVKEWGNKPVTKIISPAVNPDLHSMEFANGFKSDLLAKIWEEYGKFNGLQLSTQSVY